MPIRISGLASGMDIDTTIKELMKAHRKPLDKLTQQKQIWEWNREDYRSINSKLMDFKNNKLFKYNLESSLQPKKAEITGDTTAVSVQTTNGAVSGSMNIMVTQLATSSTLTTTPTLDGDGKEILKPMDSSKTLNELKVSSGLAFTSNTITINGKPLTVDPSVDTIASLVSQINSDKDMGVSAIFDEATAKKSLMAKETGAGTISVTGDLLTGAGAFNLNTALDGKNSQFSLNGMQLERTTNRFTINGVDITLKAKSNGQASSINVVSDTDKAIETIKSFINDYNEMVDAIQTKLKEERFRKFTPLTAEQKKDMKDDEIKNWEEKAKSGLLRNDSVLEKIVMDARAIMSASIQVGSPPEDYSANSIGIETGKWFEGGKLQINEDKLRAALENEPDKVSQLFLSKGENGTGIGLFEQLSTKVNEGMVQISKKAGTYLYNTTGTNFNPESTIGEELKYIDRRITDWNRILVDKENQYYKKFSAMETAINRFNSQSSSLFSNS